MISLQEYFFESDIESLKKTIKNNVDSTKNIKILKKVNKCFELSEQEYADVKKSILDYFNNHCGWNKKIAENIRQKIKIYGATKLFGKIIKDMNNESSNNKYVLTGEKIINGSNLYDLIRKYVYSIVDNDDDLKNDFDKEEFDRLLEDIGGFTLGGKVATGAFEFLSAIFLKDLNPKNGKGNNKEVCDINTKDYGLEYKASGARIGGNKEESKPLSPQKIDEKFIELIKKEVETTKEIDTQKNKDQYSSAIRSHGNLDKDLEQALKEKDVNDFIESLAKRDNLFRNGDPKYGGIQLSSVLEPLISFGIIEERLNYIVIDSLLAQVPNLECDNSTKKYLIDKYPIIKEGKSNNTNLRNIFLILGLCNYWNAEKWNYLILFDTIENSNYYVIDAPKSNNLIKSIDENIKNKAYSNANPAFGKGTNSQNHEPMIKYKK